jgi:hypothetical protein
MANNCSVRVTIRGDINPIVDWVKSQDWSHGNLPVDGERYFFDVQIENHVDGCIELFFWTKWCPPLDELKRMAEKYCVDINGEYEELGMAMMGGFGFGSREYHVWLDDSDWNKLDYDEDNDTYTEKSTGELVDSYIGYYWDLLEMKMVEHLK